MTLGDGLRFSAVLISLTILDAISRVLLERPIRDTHVENVVMAAAFAILWAIRNPRNDK